MKKTQRSALPFLLDHMEAAEHLLTAEELGHLYVALRRYAVDSDMPEMEEKSTAWRAVFEMMAHAQDKARILYEETCERNRAAANMRWHKRAQ